MAVEPNYDLTAATWTCGEVIVVTLKVTPDLTQWQEVSGSA